MKTRLKDIASTIRSKNGGVDHITFDIIFSKNEIFQKVKNSNAINPESIAKLYKVELSRIEQFSFFEPAMAIKFSIRRERPSGSPGESDVFGCQQYPPLFDIEIPNLED